MGLLWRCHETHTLDDVVVKSGFDASNGGDDHLKEDGVGDLTPDGHHGTTGYGV